MGINRNMRNVKLGALKLLRDMQRTEEKGDPIKRGAKTVTKADKRGQLSNIRQGSTVRLTTNYCFFVVQPV
jgi:hypothetical protein